MPNKTDKNSNNPKNKNPLIKINIKPNINVNISDFAGIGALAKSEAAKEIARALAVPFSELFAKTSKSIFGNRIARIDNQNKVIEAKAKAEVLVITAKAEEEARTIRTISRRIILHEIERQKAIEQATIEAITITNEIASSNINVIKDDFAYEWINAVKDVRSDVVRKLYSEILANQASSNPSRISSSSMLLLKNLDGHLALELAKFTNIYETYGAYPAMDNVTPSGKSVPDVKSINLLIEIGFIKKIKSSYLNFKDVTIALNLIKSNNDIEKLVFTERGFELVKAFYGDKPLQDGLIKYKINEKEKVSFYEDIILSLGKGNPAGVRLVFNSPHKAANFAVSFQFDQLEEIYSFNFEPKPVEMIISLGDIKSEMKKLGITPARNIWKALSLVYCKSCNCMMHH